MRAPAIVGNCIFPSSFIGFVPTQASVAGEVDSRYALTAPNAMPRPECRSAGLKSMKQSSCAAFGLAVKPPAEPCYPSEADLAMRKHRPRRGLARDEVRH